VESHDRRRCIGYRRGHLLGMMNKPGLYANILAKQERIKHGSGERMRKPGEPGAPTAKAFRESAKTVKPENKK